MLTVKQIEAFVWATRLGSFADAASRLHITQSTLSKRIAELEHALGGCLFERMGQRATPTDFAHDIRDLAEQMLDLRDAMMSRATQDLVPSGRVAFGITELVARLWLPEWVGRMRDAFSKVELEPLVDVSAPLLAALRSGRIDVAVAPVAPRDEMFVVEDFAEVKFVMMASPVLNPPAFLDRDALARWPMLAQSGGSGLTGRFDAWATTHGLQLQQSLASNSLVAISELVLAGLGSALLPLEPYRKYLEDGRLQRIEGPVPWPTLKYYLLTRKGDRSRAATALARIILSSTQTPPDAAVSERETAQTDH